MAYLSRNSAVLVLAWPEVSAWADDCITNFFRAIGVVKNLNLMVGHAAMMVVHADGLRYYDFGRYITPRYLGRIRSAETDPLLNFTTRPQWNEAGRLENIAEICAELESKSAFTHGEGLMQLSVYYAPNAEFVEAKARAMQYAGPIGYHGLKPSQSNCARFVQTAVLAGLGHEPSHFRRFRRPVTYLAPTPYFNVLAAAKGDGSYAEWRRGALVWKQAPLYAAWWDVTAKIFSSASRKKTAHLQKDDVIGKLHAPATRPETVPESAIYLGGIGEGAWYTLEVIDRAHLESSRYNLAGQREYTATYKMDQEAVDYVQSGEAQLLHDSHYAWVTLALPNGMIYRSYRRTT